MYIIILSFINKTMDENINFINRRYLRLSALIVPIFVFVSVFKYIKQDPIVLKFVVLFLLGIAFIIIITSDQKIMIRQEFMIIKKGLRKRKILYQNIIELDFKHRFWKPQDYYFKIIFRTNTNRRKSVVLEPIDFGMDNILKIVDVLVHKNKGLGVYKNRFLNYD